MNTFLKTLRVFFVILGVIFFLLIVAVFYLYQTDFYGIKTMINYEKEEVTTTNDINKTEDKNSALSAEQEAQLESIGVDPATVPSEVTPEMEDCFIQKLGEERVREIEDGSSPTALELIKAKPCLD
ncbi:MAG TPA: hypothetical protein VJ926_01335 [Patescibacteria group bacterium]|nr:hypothetical protein [Patescibacteria group bacterium]